MKTCLILCLLVVISACTNTMDSVEQGVTQDYREFRGVVANEIYPEGALTAPAITAQEHVHCYKSWSDSTCYQEPVAGQEYHEIK